MALAEAREGSDLQPTGWLTIPRFACMGIFFMVPRSDFLAVCQRQEIYLTTFHILWISSSYERCWAVSGSI